MVNNSVNDGSRPPIPVIREPDWRIYSMANAYKTYAIGGTPFAVIRQPDWRI